MLVRVTLIATIAVLGFAALVHIARYVLLLINRTMLLPPLVAGAGLWLGVLASLAAIAVVILCVVVLTGWLIARRSAVFRHLGHHDPRPTWSLWAGCLIPVVNLVWAPVYVIELATAEDSYSRLRRPIVVFWIAWVFSTAVSTFAIATSFASDAQGIADNTVTVIFAYLVAVATVLLAMRMFDGFVRKPVERPLHRWVVVADERPADDELALAVEPEGQEPAA